MEARWVNISPQCTHLSIMNQWMVDQNNSTTQIIRWALIQMQTRRIPDSQILHKEDLEHKTEKDLEVLGIAKENPVKEHQECVDAAKCESINTKFCNTKV